jgi:hypothetical protein
MEEGGAKDGIGDATVVGEEDEPRAFLVEPPHRENPPGKGQGADDVVGDPLVGRADDAAGRREGGGEGRMGGEGERKGGREGGREGGKEGGREGQRE